MTNILDFDLIELKNWMNTNGEKEFRAKQVFDCIYKYVWDFDEMANIPKATKEKLKKAFYIGIPSLVTSFSSLDGSTEKYLLKFQDGNMIECVVMKYNYGNSICVSTQVGCRMGCKFCASTIDGLVRNITSGEILSQVILAQKTINERISNIVLMGSGEPLDNFENVIKFINLVNAEYGLNIGQRHITISTSGIVPKIYELADKKLQSTLAISLHAPNDSARKEIMPIANKYSIEQLLNSCNYYIEKTNKRISFEYSLVKGINDNEKNALELAKLIKGMLCHVNLIPVNKVTEKNYEKPSKEAIRKFAYILKENGIECTVRKEMGSDINAACGQLRRDFIKENETRC